MKRLHLRYTGKDKVKITFNAPADADDVDQQVNLLDEEDKEHQRILCELIRTLYKTVPLYSLKGHTRTELEEESQEARFHVIQGGKE